MLKWTVKKRLTDEHSVNMYGDENKGIKKIHSRRSMGDALTDSQRHSRNNRRRSLGNFHNRSNNNNRLVERSFYYIYEKINLKKKF